MKKIQEYISHEQNLKDLLDDDNNEQTACLIQAVFAQFFKLDNEENMNKVLRNPENWVLKPQREGGGNNYYKSEIR